MSDIGRMSEREEERKEGSKPGRREEKQGKGGRTEGRKRCKLSEDEEGTRVNEGRGGRGRNIKFRDLEFKFPIKK